MPRKLGPLARATLIWSSGPLCRSIFMLTARLDHRGDTPREVFLRELNRDLLLRT